MTASDHNLIVDVAAFSDFYTWMYQHTPTVMVEARACSDRSLCRQNAIEKDVQDDLNQSRYNRNVVKVAPAGNRMKS
jgi:hypothetical protein